MYVKCIGSTLENFGVFKAHMSKYGQRWGKRNMAHGDQKKNGDILKTLDNEKFGPYAGPNRFETLV